jgi:hypothetical protein
METKPDTKQDSAAKPKEQLKDEQTHPVKRPGTIGLRELLEIRMKNIRMKK